MSFIAELSPTAEADLKRLFDFLLDRAETSEDVDRAQAANPPSKRQRWRRGTRFLLNPR
mgnify:CR=1 FL=1